MPANKNTIILPSIAPFLNMFINKTPSLAKNIPFIKIYILKIVKVKICQKKVRQKKIYI